MQASYALWHHVVNTGSAYACLRRCHEERSAIAATLSPDRKKSGAEVIGSDVDGLYGAYHE